MGRAPCCDKANVKKGPWSPEEDAKLKDYIQNHGTGGNWIALPQKVGLKRCGKSCRLRWLNYLRPNIKHGEFSDEEDRVIINLFANIGSRWSIIAAQLPGRTDNDIKNYWNTKLKKKLMGIMVNNQSQSQTHLRSKSSPNNNLIFNNNNNNNNISASPPNNNNYHINHQPYNNSYNNNNMVTSSMMNMTQMAKQSVDHNQSSIINDQTPSSSSSSSIMMINGQDHQSLFMMTSHQFNHQYSISSCSSDNNQFDHPQADVANNSDDNYNNIDYYAGIEEIKGLISSGNNNNNNNNSNVNYSSCGNNFLLFDENKTEQERLLYNYY